MYLFKSETTINKPLQQVFDFFCRAENLQLLTPPWLNFKILTPLPISMQPDTIIDYQIKLFGFPLKWKTKITIWDPPFRFVDMQLRGPYKKWIHEHRFEEVNGKTRMYDFVEYDFTGLFVKGLINSIFVGRNVQKIFQYRQEKILEIFQNDRIEG